MTRMIIQAEDYGIHPDTGVDYTVALFQLLADIKGQSGITLLFKKGIYHFNAEHALETPLCISNHDTDGFKKFAFILQNLKDFVLDGQGAEFKMSGEMGVAYTYLSEQITFKNFSVDWDRPILSQALITEVSNQHAIIEIDSNKYPYRVKDGQLYLIGDGFEHPVFLTLEYDTNLRSIAAESHDNPFRIDYGDSLVFPKVVEEIKPGVIKLIDQFHRLPKVGNTLVIRHGMRDHPAIFSNHSKQIHLENINIYHADGMGFIAQNCSDISLSSFNVMLRENSDRYFTAFADATHFVNCSGEINIENCLFENMMDDAINVHGIYNQVIHKLSDTQLMVAFDHYMQLGNEIASPMDTMNIISKHSLITKGSIQVQSVQIINRKYAIITTVSPAPEWLDENYVLENMSWSPSLKVTNCTVRNNRARGMLITTANRVIIEKCYFHTSGAAIKISGDANSWYESGAVTDVLIQHNTFEDCVYVPGAWGKGVIDIDPEIEVFEENQFYHQNIQIKGNLFKTFGSLLVSGFGVNGLTFSDNEIIKTSTYQISSSPSSTGPIELTHSKNIVHL